MDKKRLVNPILFSIFIIFTILYFSFISRFIDETIGKPISTGIYLIIAGVLGFCINGYVLKIFIFEKKPWIINSLLIVIGVIVLISTLIT